MKLRLNKERIYLKQNKMLENGYFYKPFLFYTLDLTLQN